MTLAVLSASVVLVPISGVLAWKGEAEGGLGPSNTRSLWLLLSRRLCRRSSLQVFQSLFPAEPL